MQDQWIFSAQTNFSEGGRRKEGGHRGEGVGEGGYGGGEGGGGEGRRGGKQDGQMGLLFRFNPSRTLLIRYQEAIKKRIPLDIHFGNSVLRPIYSTKDSPSFLLHIKENDQSLDLSPLIGNLFISTVIGANVIYLNWQGPLIHLSQKATISQSAKTTVMYRNYKY